MKKLSVSKTNSILLVGIFAVAVLLVVSTFFLNSSMKTATVDSTNALGEYYLSVMAENVVNEIESGIELRKSRMTFMAEEVTAEERQSVAALQAYIKRMQKVNMLSGLAFMDDKGRVYTENEVLDAAAIGLDFFKAPVTEPVYEATRRYGSGAMIVVAVPVRDKPFLDGRLVACFSNLNAERVARSIKRHEGDDQVICRIFTNDGICIATPDSRYENGYSVFEKLESEGVFANGYSLEKMKDDWKNMRRGYINYSVSEGPAYMSYLPVRGTNWMVNARLRHSIIDRQIVETSERIYQGSMIQLLLVVAAMVVVFLLVMNAVQASNRVSFETEKSEELLRQKHEAAEERLLFEKETNRLLQERQQALSDALSQAEAASRAKTDFLSNMSHDIRTPMNAIIGFTSLGIRNLDDREKVRDYLNKINTSSEHLLSLINDILDMSRIESGKLRINEQENCLCVLVSEMQNILQADMKAHGLEFSVEQSIEHEQVYCDKLRINQVLLNCLGNAMKFTPEGGKVRFALNELPQTKEGYGRYELHVADTGIGMSEEFLQHIFEPFERERTSTVSGVQGTGLGMAITKNVVEMMGGEISVTSAPGKGTEFIITLDFRLVERASVGTVAEPEAEAGKDGFAGRKLLIVEDNELNLEIAKTLLEDAGFTVDTAENGQLAVDRIKGGIVYDAVLMDLQMPVMGGVEATRRIRALEDRTQAEVPIIAMTANAFEEDRQMTAEAGMNGHVAKPIDVKLLFEALREVL